MKKIITFFHQKTAGNTLLSLNAALATKLTNPQQKVAYMQMGYFPDASDFVGAPMNQNWSNLLAFESDQLTPSILQKCAHTHELDFYWSPNKEEWTSISAMQVTQIIKSISTHYESVILDISGSLPNEIIDEITKESDYFFCTTFGNPTHFKQISTNPLLKKISQKHLIVNQSNQSNFLEKIFPKQFAVPTEKASILWSQIYEGMPVIYNKKSKIAKALKEIIAVWK